MVSHSKPRMLLTVTHMGAVGAIKSLQCTRLHVDHQSLLC